MKITGLAITLLNRWVEQCNAGTVQFGSDIQIGIVTVYTGTGHAGRAAPGDAFGIAHEARVRHRRRDLRGLRLHRRSGCDQGATRAPTHCLPATRLLIACYPVYTPLDAERFLTEKGVWFGHAAGENTVQYQTTKRALWAIQRELTKNASY